ncbi:MAG: hypothetical protein AAF664_25630, partial [Planctomycetota bacterium]
RKSHLLQCGFYRPMIFKTSGTITLNILGNLIRHEGNQPLPLGLGPLSLLPFKPLPVDGKDASIDRKPKTVVRADQNGVAMDPLKLVGTLSVLRKTAAMVPDKDWHSDADSLTYFEYKANYRLDSSTDSTSYTDDGIFVFNPMQSMPEAANFNRVSKGLEYAGLSGKLQTNVKFRQYRPTDRWLVLSGIFPQNEPLSETVFEALGDDVREQLLDIPALESEVRKEVFDHICRRAPPDCQSDLQKTIEELALRYPLDTTKANLPFQLRDSFDSSPTKRSTSTVSFYGRSTGTKNNMTTDEINSRLAQELFLNWHTRRQNARTHVRSWRDASGQFALEATLSGRIGNTAVLRSAEDDSIKRVPIGRLDATSQFIITHYAMTPEAIGRAKAILATYKSDDGEDSLIE